VRDSLADKGYDSQPLRETLREIDIRPLVKHRVFAPYDHAHNARIEDELYNQRSMTETVNSSVTRSYGESSRAAVNERQIEVDGEIKWLHAAIDTDSRLLLEIDVFSRRGVSPAAAFLHRLTENHETSDTDFLVGGGYLTALARHESSGHLNYSTLSHIKKWFQTVSMRIDRFHSFWRGSPASARR